MCTENVRRADAQITRGCSTEGKATLMREPIITITLAITTRVYRRTCVFLNRRMCSLLSRYQILVPLLRSRQTLDRSRSAHRHTRLRQTRLVSRRHIIVIHRPPSTAQVRRASTSQRAGLIANKASLALQHRGRSPAFPSVLESEDSVGTACGIKSGVGGG